MSPAPWTLSIIQLPKSKTKFRKLDLLPIAGEMLVRQLLSWVQQEIQRSVIGYHMPTYLLCIYTQHQIVSQNKHNRKHIINIL
jgi:hypothetical protein